MHKYTLAYMFNGEPRTHIFELKQPQLSVHEAAMHLLQLHFGDGRKQPDHAHCGRDAGGDFRAG